MKKVCKICGYNPNKPIGISITEAISNRTCMIELNENGKKGVNCKIGHLKDKFVKENIIVVSNKKPKES